jgi:heme/copper-type cytochrome/quinol oxidase subunit 2
VRTRGIVELVVAGVAAVACVLCWLSASTTDWAPPVAANEPLRPSVTYDPTLVVLALVLATIAGVFAVVGVAHARRG